MSLPRLVLVVRRFWPLVGGAENAIANLAGELACCGCRVTVLTAKWHQGPSEIHYRQVPVVRLSPPPRHAWSTIRYMQAVGRWLRRHEQEYDLVYVSGLKHEAYAAMQAVGQRRPVVLRAEDSGRWGDCLWQIEAPCGRRIKRRLMRAAAVVGRTPAVQRELIAAGYPRQRIHGIADGVPVPPPRDEVCRAVAREALGSANLSMRVPPEAPVAVYAGRLNEPRGIGDLLEAWVPIAAQWPTARLWLAGDGPFQIDVADYLVSHDLSGRVLLAGVFDCTEELRMAADLFVLPSREGSASLALLEAMAAGLPIVATRLADHGEFVADQQQALLVPPRDPAALSQAIARVFSDRQLAARLGAAARQRAIEQFSLARMAREHLQLWEKLLTDKLVSPQAGGGC